MPNANKLSTWFLNLKYKRAKWKRKTGGLLGGRVSTAVRRHLSATPYNKIKPAWGSASTGANGPTHVNTRRRWCSKAQQIDSVYNDDQREIFKKVNPDAHHLFKRIRTR